MSEITVEQIVQLPLPGMNVPGSLSFSPDGNSVIYLYSEDGSLTRQLYAFDLDTAVSKQIIIPPNGGTTDNNIFMGTTLATPNTIWAHLKPTQTVMPVAV